MAYHQSANFEKREQIASKTWVDESRVEETQVPAQTSSILSLQRTVADPRAASPRDILTLHHMTGNRAVSRLIQAKLTVGPAHDRYEQEADRGQQVMRILKVYRAHSQHW